MPDEPEPPSRADGIEMPKPTAAPLVVGVGLVLMGAGVALNLTLSAVGAALLLIGLALWIGNLLPNRGHHEVGRVPPEQRPKPIEGTLHTVEKFEPPGYRLQLPRKIHPIATGIQGGLVGGLVMPVPALAWGLFSGHGLWFPVNLLVGMVWPGVNEMSVAELEQFHLSFLVVGIVIHGAMSLVLGLMYGVLLPTLPSIRGGELVWGGILMPLLWTGVAHGMMGVVNPLLDEKVDWYWFVVSQFVFGLAASIVVVSSKKVDVGPRGTGPS